MRYRSKALLLFAAFETILWAQPPVSNDAPLQLPGMLISDSSLLMGAQFNPFVNSFTKKMKYVHVSHLQAGSVAARAGLKDGDRVVEIDGVRLSDYKISEVPAIHVPAVNRQARVDLVVRRKGISEPLKVTLVFDNFTGSIDWEMSKATVQKKMLKVDDWHVDKASKQDSSKPAPR